jgi:hypothetical protein
MKLYLGVPQEEWNLLMAEAEELMHEEAVGSHILGIYPCGDRLYGDESATPDLFCMYINDPGELLNPCLHGKPGWRGFRIGQGSSFAGFKSLFHWVYTISVPNGPMCSFHENLYHLIPTMTAPLYEDPQLTVLMDLARDYQGERGWDYPAFCQGHYRRNHDLYKYARYLRMRVILQATDAFAPCINKEWGHGVVMLGDIVPTLKEIDKWLVSQCGAGWPNPRTHSLEEYVNGLETWLRKNIVREEAKAELETLGGAVKNLYKRLL